MNQIIEKYIRKQVYETPIIVSRKISTEENIKFNKREDYYKLQQRADGFLNRENKKRFFVLPGLRGVGKTTLLLQIYEYLLNEKNVNPKNLLYVSCEEINFAGEVNIKEVIESYLKIFHNTTPTLLDEDVFIFIDEVHYDRNWAMAGKIMFDKSPHIFMIFTGSSSLHLSYNADAARRLRTQSILPLNYSEHLKLKYNYFTDISKDLNDLIFKGEVESAQKKELKIQNDLISVKDYKLNDWDNYFKYGSFPSTLNEKYTSDIVRDLWSIIYRIVSNDISNIFNINRNTQNLIYRILTFLAEQKPGEISQNKVAASLNCSTSRINSIFNILEQTQLIFHCEAYGGIKKRVRKSWKYYLATPSVKNCINETLGNTILDKSDYEGVLLENLVASSLHNLSYTGDLPLFNTYYDMDKGGVDFIVQKHFQTPIPIEVGMGKKDNKQIKKAINKLNADYGIVISNKTSSIEKDEDIIYISPKTFSLL